ncbi:MAG: HlyD family secretion protein [Maricaulaceae bacterium]
MAALDPPPRQSLFRSEAVSGRRRRLEGEVFLAQPAAIGVATALALIAALAGALFATFGAVARTQTVVGFLAPSGGVAQVFANRGGVIDQVYVTNGDRVARGSPLLKVNLDVAGDGGNLVERQLAQLDQRAADIERRRQALDRRFAAEATRADARLAAIDQDIAAIGERIALQTDITDLAQADLDAMQTLRTRGVAADATVAERARAALREQAALQDLERTRQDLINSRSEAAFERAEIPGRKAEAVEALRAEALDLDDRRVELEVSGAYLVTAPVDGVVAGLQARTGQTARDGLPLLAVLPDTSTLQAVLLAPSRAAGFIAPGQQVRIAYDAFPKAQFGVFTAHVTEVSQTAFAPGELAAPVGYEEPVYRIIAALDRQSVTAYGDAIALQPGMTLSGDMVIDNRPIWRWAFDPILTRGG